jgi:hypothetical protein
MCIACSINAETATSLSSLRFAPLSGGTAQGSAFFAVFAVPGEISYETNVYSYGVNGALACAGWWMAGLLDPTAAVQIDVWSQEYRG